MFDPVVCWCCGSACLYIEKETDSERCADCGTYQDDYYEVDDASDISAQPA